MATVIALTGGIGSGKSTVARALRVWGYEVFDCDSQAKAVMDADDEIKRRIAAEIAADAVKDGCIDRECLAHIVFADDAMLDILNSIVHGAVKRRISHWIAERSLAEIVFVETAILYSSGLCRMVDGELRVEAPEEVRIERVMRRNRLSREAVVARIDAQRDETSPANPLRRVDIIVNDGIRAVMPQLLAYIGDTTASMRCPDASV